MRNIKLILLIIAGSGMVLSCKKQLNIQNPNNPTPASASTESGIISLAEGGIYTGGFTSNGIKYYDGVMGAFFAGVYGFHSIMGDEVDDEAANEYLNQLGCPYSTTLDNATVVINNQAPTRQPDLIRQVDQNSYTSQNPLYYEWAYMYNLNNEANVVLSLLDPIKFSGDSATKKNTIRAWCHWWKGYAYSRIGSMYYAGLINNTPNLTNNNYVTKQAIIEEAASNFNQAATLLSGITNTSDYMTVMGQLIPDIFQVGKGVVPTTSQWIAQINTYLARNILANTPVASMTSAQWDSIATFTASGVTASDPVFSARADQNGEFISYTSGTVAAKAVGDPNSEAAYIISERLAQDFKTGDQRFANNFQQLASPYIYPDRGIALGTRWELVDGGNGMNGVVVLGVKQPLAYELYMGVTYEENALMAAEADIYKGQTDPGLAIIDAVRTYQGAGLAAVSGTGLTQALALEELRKERRSALVFRGLAYYDARRWGVIYSTTVGGGRTGAWLTDITGGFNSNATIDYDYLDYWDVPDNELAYNPASATSAPVKNPAK